MADWDLESGWFKTHVTIPAYVLGAFLAGLQMVVTGDLIAAIVVWAVTALVGLVLYATKADPRSWLASGGWIAAVIIGVAFLRHLYNHPAVPDHPDFHLSQIRGQVISRKTNKTCILFLQVTLINSGTASFVFGYELTAEPDGHNGPPISKKANPIDLTRLLNGGDAAKQLTDQMHISKQNDLFLSTEAIENAPRTGWIGFGMNWPECDRLVKAKSVALTLLLRDRIGTEYKVRNTVIAWEDMGNSCYTSAPGLAE